MQGHFRVRIVEINDVSGPQIRGTGWLVGSRRRVVNLHTPDALGQAAVDLSALPGDNVALLAHDVIRRERRGG